MIESEREGGRENEGSEGNATPTKQVGGGKQILRRAINIRGERLSLRERER